MPSLLLLQRELLQHFKDDYLSQMRGNTDTEFLFVLLLSLLEGDGDGDVQRAVAEALSDDADGWSHVEFGEVVFLERKGEHVSTTVRQLDV